MSLNKKKRWRAGGDLPRVLVLHPGHGWSTADVSTGLAQGFRAVGCAVDEYNYNSQLTFYNVALKTWAERNVRFEYEGHMAYTLAAEQVVPVIVDFVPDVIVAVCGLAFDQRGYELIDRLDLPMVTVLTESPYADEHQARMIRQTPVVAAFTNERNSVSTLEEAVEIPVHYLPHSFNPEIHKLRAVGDDYKSDVFFHGTLWPERIRMFGSLGKWAREAHPDWKVVIGGVDITDSITVDMAKPNEELALRYSGTKIALNHNRTVIGEKDGEEWIANPDDMWSIGPRAYEIAACGAFQLCDDTRGELVEVFRDTVPQYATAGELQELVEHYMHDDTERERLAEMAWLRVQGCRFKDRVQNVILPVLESVLLEGGNSDDENIVGGATWHSEQPYTA
jgi:spore maturation protein CgeB